MLLQCFYDDTFTSQSKTGAPTTMSVPHVERDVQHGSGVYINIDNLKSDDDEETDDEMDTDDNEDKPHDILLTIGFHHGPLIYLRKHALHQLREQEGEEM